MSAFLFLMKAIHIKYIQDPINMHIKFSSSTSNYLFTQTLHKIKHKFAKTGRWDQG